MKNWLVVTLLVVFIVTASLLSLHGIGLSKHQKTAIYLDNNGTTKIFDDSLEIMNHIYKCYYGNASAIYSLGAKSKLLLEHCRSRMAKMLGCDACEVFFTSGATESNNIAIRGIYTKHKERGKHVIATSIEHPSVTETVNSLPGADVTFLPVDRWGKIDLVNLSNAIRKDTVIVCVIGGNNEVGTIQDIRGIAAVCKEKGVHFHCDLTQMVGRYAIDLKDMGVDSATGSGHKFHAPKGTGFLYLKTGSYFENCVSSGTQEKSVRGGTECIPGIVSMCYSLHMCHALLQRGKDREVMRMRDWARTTLLAAIPGSILNGHPKDCLYNTLSMCMPCNSRKLVMMLDKRDVYINTGSACSKGEGSKILDALGVPKHMQSGSVRISLGFMNTWDEVRTAVGHIAACANHLRSGPRDTPGRADSPRLPSS
jgi:cysteine desulfurase